VSAEIFAGTAFSLPTKLTVRLQDAEDIMIKARYHTKPWFGSPYYALRLGYDKWSTELVHHKLYLQNPSNGVESFNVSHGYNMAFVNRAFTPDDAVSIFRLGLGMVVGHPEGRIKGRDMSPVKSFLGGGYHIAGVCVQVAFGPAINVIEHFFFRPEVKLTAAWARMPINGNASVIVPNIAIHTLLGIGYTSVKARSKACA
jgi:hypothetical protein